MITIKINGKKVKTEKGNKILDVAKEIGIGVGINALFGFPGEELKDGLRTLRFVEQIKADKYYHNVLCCCGSQKRSNCAPCCTGQQYDWNKISIQSISTLHDDIFWSKLIKDVNDLLSLNVFALVKDCITRSHFPVSDGNSLGDRLKHETQFFF